MGVKLTKKQGKTYSTQSKILPLLCLGHSLGSAPRRPSASECSAPPQIGCESTWYSLPKIVRNLTVQHSVSENIDIDSFVSVEILRSASLHALLVYEKGFDALGVRE